MLKANIFPEKKKNMCKLYDKAAKYDGIFFENVLHHGAW